MSLYSIKRWLILKAMKTFTTSINRAIYRNDERRINILIRDKIDLNQPDIFSYSPFLVASSIGNSKILKMLFEANVDQQKRPDDGSSPLILAVDSGKYDAVEYLISLNLFNFDETDNCGITPLILACGIGSMDIVQLLLNHGADVNHRAHSQGETPLNSSIVNGGHKKIVELLLKRGAKVDVANIYGLTPLMHAARNGHEEIIKMLVEYGADLTPKDNMGITALRWAELKMHKNIYRYLENQINNKNK
jgi:ankyrin repeat protein